jgi:hypothetical protein
MFSSIDFLGSSPAKEVSKGFLITQISLRSFLGCSSFRDCAPALWGDSHSGCGEGQQVLCILEERARPVGGDGTSVPDSSLEAPLPQDWGFCWDVSLKVEYYCAETSISTV